MSNPHFTRRYLLQLTTGYGVTSFWSTPHAQQTTSRDDATLEQWRFDTDGVVTASPTIVGGILYIGSQDGRIYAIDVTTGQVVWSVTTEREVSSSVTVIDGTVYVGSRDENVYAFDAESGEKQWVTNIGSSIMMSSPTTGGDYVYVGSWSGGVHALELATGREVWTYESGGNIQRSSPTVVDETVFIGSGDNHLYALDAASGDEQWAFETGGEVRSSPTVVNEHVYVGSFDQSVYAVDTATGEEIWSIETDSHIGTSSPTVAYDTVFIGSYDDSVYALDASTGDEQWQFETSTSINSSPTVADGLVFIGNSAPRGAPNLYALDAMRGHLVWRYDTDGPILGSPTVVDGILYIGSYDSSVYAFPTNVDGSSTDSRVLLGTLGHHDDVSRGKPVTPPTADQALLADFTVTPADPVVDETVVFDASASQVVDGEIVAYEWDFTGDGDPDRTGERVEYTFTDRGLAQLSLTVVTATGAEDTVTRAIAVETAESDFEISIAETNAPVEGGDQLTVTVTVTNHGAEAQRPELAVFFDNERTAGMRTTIDPGDTYTHSTDYRTYPVTDDADIAIRAEVESETIEQTATVTTVDEIDPEQTYPTDDPEIQPETHILFEVASELAEPDGEIHWYVDGEHHVTMGPWHSMYASETGREFFSQRFEATGTQEVAAAIVRDTGNQAIRWTVTVTDEGAAPPVIEAARPVTSVLKDDEEYTLELDVSSPTTDLDRVVWWMTQADTIIGVSELSDRSGTAALDIEGGCQTCGIEAWVLDENNAYRSLIPWQFEGYDTPAESLDERDGVDVLILTTNSPLVANETVDVRVMVENTNAETVTREIELVLGEEELVVDTQTVTLDAGETDQITLTSPVLSKLKEEWISFHVHSNANQDDGVVYVKRKNTE